MAQVPDYGFCYDSTADRSADVQINGQYIEVEVRPNSFLKIISIKLKLSKF